MSFGTEPGLKHTYWQGPWHYCDRCDRKNKIAKMKWERGLLLCIHCQDSNSIKGPGLLGDRDVKIAQTLSDGKSDHEFAPVEKIKDPSFVEEVEDFLI